MLGFKKKKRKSRKIREKKTLAISNMGDIVVIKHRYVAANAIVCTAVMAILIAIFFKLEAVWDEPVFWVMYLFMFFSNIYSLWNTVIGKIVLTSKDSMMTVYWPFKKEYKFSDISYVDLKSSKVNDGYVTHRVLIYVGEGRKCVKLETFSSSQAEDLASLLRGMLDCGSMEYQEGNEESFNLPSEEEKKPFAFFRNLFKKADKQMDEPTEFIGKKNGANGKKNSKPTKKEEVDFEPVFEPLKEKVDVVKHDDKEND